MTVPTATLESVLGFVLFSPLLRHLHGREGLQRAQKGFLVLGSGSLVPAALTRRPCLGARRIFGIATLRSPVKIGFCLFFKHSLL